MDPFVPTGLAEGSLSLAVVFAAIGFVGFESTAVFRDEMRDPDRTIPRATYFAIVSIGLFYVLASWAATVAYGRSAVVAAAQNDPGGFFTASVQNYLGSVAVHIVSVMLVMSYLAGVICEQSILSRYLHSLGVDGVLGRAVGRVHVRHGSPYVANVLTSAVLLVLFLPWMAEADPTVPSSVLGAAGLLTLMAVMALASFAVLAYFRRRPRTRAGMWPGTVAPLIAGALLVIVMVLGVRNFDTVSGAGGALSWGLLAVAVGAGLLGPVVASVLRRRRPDVHRRVGRRSAE